MGGVYTVECVVPLGYRIRVRPSGCVSFLAMDISNEHSLDAFFAVGTCAKFKMYVSCSLTLQYQGFDFSYACLVYKYRIIEKIIV